MSGDITDLVDKLEDMNRMWADIYNAELQNELGKPFGVLGLTKYDLYNSIQDYFFPVRCNENDFGIILPFRNKAFGISRAYCDEPIEKDFKKFKEVLENKGYKVEYGFNNMMALVEEGRKD